MKKNTLIYLIVFAALAVTAAILVLKKSSTTLPKALTDFAVKDTASITKMHLTDHFNNDIVLEKKGPGSWMVNGKYKAETSQVEILLQTIKEVEVKNPVPIPARDNMIKDLAVNGIKIEIFNNNELIKSYYVGGSTADDEGTIMLVQGSSEPFVTHIPGFIGYLTTRYLTKVQDWRSSEIYHLNPADITEISVQYPGNPDQSFILQARENEYFLTQKDPAGAAKMNRLFAIHYLMGFKAINYEAVPDFKPREVDSILANKPYAIINVATPTRKYPPLKLYARMADIKTKDVDPKSGADLNRFYGIIGDNNKEIVLCQAFLMKKLLASYSDLANGKGTIK